jgi:tetratricopeptide (TPR) repeat protein
MKNILFTLALIVSFSSFGQDSTELDTSNSESYLGWITKTVNLRKGPGLEYSIIKTLEAGKQIFIISDVSINNYYNIIDIESNTDGFVYKSFIETGDKVEKSKGEMFTSTGNTDKYETQVEIFNNTDKTLTLKLNKKSHRFSPKEKTTISIKPGLVNYIASAPNVIPLNGSKNFDEYSSWTWQFYIKQQYDNEINIPVIKPIKLTIPKINKSSGFDSGLKDYRPFHTTFPEIKNNNSFKLLPLPKPTTNAFDDFTSKPNQTKQFYNDEGIKKYETGDYKGAILDYDKSIKLDPNYAKAIYNRGLSKYELEDYLEAIKDFDKAIELGYKNPNLYTTRGLCNYKIKDYYEFLWDYDKAIELDPNVAKYYVNRGVAKEMTFNTYGAITDYSEAISINPDYALAYFKRGKAKEKTANFEGACADFNRAAYLGNEEAKRWIGKWRCK